MPIKQLWEVPMESTQSDLSAWVGRSETRKDGATAPVAARWRACSIAERLPPAAVSSGDATDMAQALGGELAGYSVVALEQAVAAPYCSMLLAHAGARV